MPEAAPYLVTGVAGFIGAKVAQLLSEEGHRVTGVDNLNHAYDPRLKEWRLGLLAQHAAFRFRQLDIGEARAVEKLFESEQRPAEAPFAAVINLAARAGVQASVENPRVYYQTNVDGTLNLLESCRRFQVEKFVLASTSSLYGDSTPVPFREDADTSRPLSPYAASKKAAETLAYTYRHLHGLDISVLRFFTVYGPAGRPDMSVFRFVRRIAAGLPITVYGDGQQQRDFTYVDDVAAGVLAGLRPMGFETINLGSDRPVPLRQLIDLISGLVGRAAEIRYQPAHAADMRRTWADISQAHKLLNWTPRTAFEDGIAACVRWYYENRELVERIKDEG